MEVDTYSVDELEPPLEWSLNDSLRDLFYEHAFTAIRKWNRTHPPSERVQPTGIRLSGARVELRSPSKDAMTEFMLQALPQYIADRQKAIGAGDLALTIIPAGEQEQIDSIRRMEKTPVVRLQITGRTL